jgi:hypothetical protein
MKYAFEMTSGGMISIPSFIKTGSGIQKFIGRDSQAHRQHDDLISLLLFFFSKYGKAKNKRRLMRSNYSTCALSSLFRFLCGPCLIKEMWTISSSQNLRNIRNT